MLLAMDGQDDDVIADDSEVDRIGEPVEECSPRCAVHALT
jgi:hypothetical protein